MFILQQLVFGKQEGEQNTMKLQCALLHIHFVSNFSPSNLYFLMPLQNTTLPEFQTMFQLGHVFMV